MDVKLRVAIVSGEKCKPSRCNLECKRGCPVVKMGKLCIEVGKNSRVAAISEGLCNGCGICVRNCPFQAIRIINLPKDMAKDVTHRFGPNTFKLHRLPVPKRGQVLGLVGTNGTGKSTALSILAGKLKPNFGNFDSPPDWKEVLARFKGNELQGYFTKILEDRLKALTKPQYVDKIRTAVAGHVGVILEKKDDRGVRDSYVKELELEHLMDSAVADLSGGELQRFAIAVSCVQHADVYIFDEPSSFLDVRQRMVVSSAVRNLQKVDNYVILVEHDLAVLDYLSDFICCLWGQAGVYGVVTMPYSVREGINIFLQGFLPGENLRFREYALNFRSKEHEEASERTHRTEYSRLEKTMTGPERSFKLFVEAGSFGTSEIIVMLGQNGTGKTTFVRMLAGLLQPDGAEADDERRVPELNVSYKPQEITGKYKGTVQELLFAKIKNAFTHPQFQSDVVKPMLIDEIKDQYVQNLSGGELQRVALVLALGKPADIYLLDEPSAHLDVEQRVVAARVIRKFILQAHKSAFIVEHDFIMATYLADRVIVYEGQPGVHCTASAPKSLLEGMNQFLEQLAITFRREPANFRPRINKPQSVKDKEQKASGNFFVLED